MAELTNEFNAALVRFDPFVFDDSVDQVVLAVPEPVHCFGLRGVVGTSFGEPDTARCEKITNAVVAGLPIHIEPVVRGDIEGAKCFASLRRALLKVLVEHLFPTGCVEVSGVRYHTVEVKEDGVVLVAGDHAPAVGLLHRPLSCYQRTSFLPAASGCRERAQTPSWRVPAASAAQDDGHCRSTGMSVVPVCCPVRLHAVSPCLIANTFTFASARVRRCRPLWNAPQRKPLPAPISSR